MWLLVADAPAPPDSQTAIVLGIIALLTGVLVAVVGGVFSVLSARANRTAPSPPSPIGDMQLHERVAILEHRADATDQADEIRDRWVDAKDQADEHRDRRLDRLEGAP